MGQKMTEELAICKNCNHKIVEFMGVWQHSCSTWAKGMPREGICDETISENMYIGIRTCGCNKAEPKEI